MSASTRIGRRAMLASSLAAMGIHATGLAHADPKPSSPTDGKRYPEPGREIPVVEECDVLVCGAGPAGVAAALAAARSGAKVRLVEVHGCLGGVWTAGLLSWILDAGNKTGLMASIVERLDKRKAAAKYRNAVAYDVERMKLVLDEMCVEAGVRVRLHTRVAAAARDASNRLQLAITESKSGREAWRAKAFIDASGDGDLAAQAGCRFELGRKETSQAQPLSMIALLTGIRVDEVRPFVNGLEQARGQSAKGNLLAEMARAGVSPSYAQPTLFYIHEGLFTLMANHEYGVSAMDAEGISAATLRSRAEVHKLVDALRALGGVWRGLQIVATCEQIGVREGRRIHGLYEVSTEDLAGGVRHDDAVCRVTFGIDVHSTDPKQTKGIEKAAHRAKPYDIPYRALIAKDVEGLLMAGRCISGDFIAHSSYRVTGNSVAMGEAAGAAAALAARTGRLPRQVPWPEIAREIASKEGKS